jgi:hypothetical protein
MIEWHVYIHIAQLTTLTSSIIYFQDYTDYSLHKKKYKIKKWATHLKAVSADKD